MCTRHHSRGELLISLTEDEEKVCERLSNLLKIVQLISGETEFKSRTARSHDPWGFTPFRWDPWLFPIPLLLPDATGRIGVLAMSRGKHSRSPTCGRLWHGNIYLYHQMPNHRNAPRFPMFHLHPSIPPWEKSNLSFIRPRNRAIVQRLCTMSQLVRTAFLPIWLA